jgi:hypothetical protein
VAQVSNLCLFFIYGIIAPAPPIGEWVVLSRLNIPTRLLENTLMPTRLTRSLKRIMVINKCEPSKGMKIVISSRLSLSTSTIDEA